MTDEYESHETDWLANSIYGYGFGYTKQQALMAMFSHADPEGEVQVDLIEHVGGATVGMGRWEVDEFVSGERITIDESQTERFRFASIEAQNKAELAIDTAEKEKIE